MKYSFWTYSDFERDILRRKERFRFSPANNETEKFKSEYLYNVRHSYGDVGGDANKRGRGYTPYSCQKLLTEPLPSSGQNHGCPYRTYSPDNLSTLLQNIDISDRELLKGVREDIGKQRYHIACNRVFESTHKNQIKKVRSCTSILGDITELTWYRLRTSRYGLPASWTQFCTRTRTSSEASC